MRSTSDDLTARATIRNTALDLFAAHGFESVTVRRIAAQAKVSPALIVHHFGNKQSLRDEVDAYVVEVFERCSQIANDEAATAILSGSRSLDTSNSAKADNGAENVTEADDNASSVIESFLKLMPPD